MQRNPPAPTEHLYQKSKLCKLEWDQDATNPPAPTRRSLPEVVQVRMQLVSNILNSLRQCSVSQINRFTMTLISMIQTIIFHINKFELWANASSTCSSSPIRKWGKSGRGEPLSPTHHSQYSHNTLCNVHNCTPPQCIVYPPHFAMNTS